MLTGYLLEWQEPGDGTYGHRTDPASTATEYTITGLTPTTAYRIRLTANGSGPGGATSTSAETSATTDAIPTLPAPTVTGSAVGDTSITVTWSVTAPAGFTVDHYTVAWRWGGNSDQTQVDSGTEHTITGLDAATTYSITVMASASRAEPATTITSTSAAIVVTTAAAPMMPAPTGVQGTAQSDNTSIKVEWDAVTVPTGFTLTGYEVEWQGSRDSVPSDHSVGATVTEHTITGLTEGTGYTISVTASGTDRDSNTVSATSGATCVPTGGGTLSDNPTFRLVANYNDRTFATGDVLALVPKSEGVIRFKIISIAGQHTCNALQQEGVVSDTSVTFSVRTGPGRRGPTITSRTSSPVTIRTGSPTADLEVRWDPNEELTLMDSDEPVVSITTCGTNCEAEPYSFWGLGLFRVTVDPDN